MNYPLLVEVRFPNCGTSSDWYLCQNQDEWATVSVKLTGAAELHIRSVWNLEVERVMRWRSLEQTAVIAFAWTES